MGDNAFSQRRRSYAMLYAEYALNQRLNVVGDIDYAMAQLERATQELDDVERFVFLTLMFGTAVGGMSFGNGDSTNPLQNVYSGKRQSPNWPSDFQSVSSKTSRVKNRKLHSQLKDVEDGKWVKVYEDGYSEGSPVSIHYF